MDSNSPSSLHWSHDVFKGGNPLPAGWKFFQQPPAVFMNEQGKWEVNPDAENLSNLPANYYENQIAGADDKYIRNLLACEPGVVLTGKPVFPNFSYRTHVSPTPLVATRSLPLTVACDVGLNPFALVGQITPRGLRIIDEVYPGDSGLEEMLDDYLLPLLRSKYAGFKINVVIDPAGAGRSGVDKRTAFDVFHARGIRAYPASTNSLAPRIEAVNFFLGRIDGLQIDPSCKVLIDGFAGEYAYELVHGKHSQYKETPVKTHPCSDAADCCQYMSLWARFGRDSSPQARRRSSDGGEERKPFAWA
jgi:hypothetical protein